MSSQEGKSNDHCQSIKEQSTPNYRNNTSTTELHSDTSRRKSPSNTQDPLGTVLGCYLIKQLKPQVKDLYHSLIESMVDKDNIWFDSITKRLQVSKEKHLRWQELEQIISKEAKDEKFFIPQGNQVSYKEKVETHARLCANYIFFLDTFTKEIIIEMEERKIPLPQQDLSVYLLTFTKHLTLGRQQLAALQILNNHAKECYNFSRQQGGHTKAKRPSKKEHEILIAALIKILMKNIPDSDLKLLKPVEKAKLYGNEIMQLQSHFPLLAFMPYIDLLSEIENIIIERGWDAAKVPKLTFERIRRSPMSRPPITLTRPDIDVESTIATGWQQGISDALKEVLKHKFSSEERLDNYLDKLKDASPIDLDTWFHRALTEKSLKSVFKNKY